MTRSDLPSPDIPRAPDVLKPGFDAARALRTEMLTKPLPLKVDLTPLQTALKAPGVDKNSPVARKMFALLRILGGDYQEDEILDVYMKEMSVDEASKKRATEEIASLLTLERNPAASADILNLRNNVMAKLAALKSTINQEPLVQASLVEFTRAAEALRTGDTAGWVEMEPLIRREMGIADATPDTIAALTALTIGFGQNRDKRQELARLWRLPTLPEAAARDDSMLDSFEGKIRGFVGGIMQKYPGLNVKPEMITSIFNALRSVFANWALNAKGGLLEKAGLLPAMRDLGIGLTWRIELDKERKRLRIPVPNPMQDTRIAELPPRLGPGGDTRSDAVMPSPDVALSAVPVPNQDQIRPLWEQCMNACLEARAAGKRAPTPTLAEMRLPNGDPDLLNAVAKYKTLHGITAGPAGAPGAPAGAPNTPVPTDVDTGNGNRLPVGRETELTAEQRLTVDGKVYTLKPNNGKWLLASADHPDVTFRVSGKDATKIYLKPTSADLKLTTIKAFNGTDSRETSLGFAIAQLNADTEKKLTILDVNSSSTALMAAEVYVGGLTFPTSNREIRVEAAAREVQLNGKTYSFRAEAGKQKLRIGTRELTLRAKGNDAINAILVAPANGRPEDVIVRVTDNSGPQETTLSKIDSLLTLIPTSTTTNLILETGKDPILG
jgi:hypothetical protein